MSHDPDDRSQEYERGRAPEVHARVLSTSQSLPRSGRLDGTHRHFGLTDPAVVNGDDNWGERTVVTTSTDPSIVP